MDACINQVRPDFLKLLAQYKTLFIELMNVLCWVYFADFAVDFNKYFDGVHLFITVRWRLRPPT